MESEIIQTYKAWLTGFNDLTRSGISEHKVKVRDLYDHAKINRSSWYRRMEDHTLWRGDEIEAVCRLLLIPLDSYSRYKELLFQLETKLEKTGLKKLKIAEILGIDYEQLYRRFNDPWMFSFTEVEKLTEVINRFE